MDKFLQHWSDVENKLGRAFVLEDGTTRDGLQDKKDELSALTQSILTAEARHQDGINQRNTARREAHPIAQQARKSILGAAASSDPAKELPTRIPAFTADVQKQLIAFRKVELAWQGVNALPSGKFPALVQPFLVLVDLHGTEELVALARYSAAITALTAAATTLETAEQVLTQAQKDRIKLIETLDAVFTAYRTLVRRLLPTTSPLYKSLP